MHRNSTMKLAFYFDLYHLKTNSTTIFNGAFNAKVIEILKTKLTLYWPIRQLKSSKIWKIATLSVLFCNWRDEV